MADITRESSRVGSLLASTNRVEAPFVRVKIGDVVFGVFERQTKKINDKNGVVSKLATQYPNYIQSLSVDKINGAVNKYYLQLVYQITENSDPNFFEKVFGSISDTFRINFTYGDALLPEYVYRDEEAIITKIRNSFSMTEAKITYDIEAVSTSTLSLSGTYTFPARRAKPSDVVKELIRSTKYHLTDVFKGMKNMSIVEKNNFIASDDRIVQIPTCTNMSILEYLAFIVSYMNPTGSNMNSAIKQNVYSLSTYEDVTNEFGGPYFKVQKIQRSQNILNQLCTYNIDIGYPSANVVTSFDVKNDQNWSLYYKYNQELSETDYLKRIDNDGNITNIYSPQLTNTHFEMNENDSTWWTKVTQYPIEATMKLKGLLRPAVLMQYVKVNVWYYGRKHILSGYYIITSQKDSISESNGYWTTLGLLRVAEDTDFYIG